MSHCRLNYDILSWTIYLLFDWIVVNLWGTTSYITFGPVLDLIGFSVPTVER